MMSHQLQLGALVLVSGPLHRLGTGKVVALEAGQCTIEFFGSISNRRLETISVPEIQPIRLAPQTRCYVQGDDGRWRMGRIGKKDSLEYEVFFRQGEARYLPESLIFVRCQTPIEDPIETLVVQGHETTYFHDRRAPLVQSLVQQRALSCGMSGLLSARIDLLPHQVEVVRRVLEDPIQRYLLADEVGLGKTVEAGVILRQYLLDNVTGSAIVIVPYLLVDQWAEELEDKFQVSRFGDDRVLVLSHEEANDRQRKDDVGLVIIDEAHHIAALAAGKLPEEQRRFDFFHRLCTSTPSLILLSATPALNNERDFLAMLHLLDPQVYQLDGVEGFMARLQKRQEVGQLILSLQEGIPSFAIKSAILRLREYFPFDAPLARLCDELQSTVEMNPPDANARDDAIRSLRVHMSETYRLHRRMLRSRRGAVEGAVLAGRTASGRDTPRTLEYDLDERASRLHELLEEWRDAATACVQSPHESSANSLIENDLSRVFRVLYLAVGTWPSALRMIVDARLNPTRPSPDAAEFAGSDFIPLRQLALFDGEREILEGILEILESPSEDGDRIELLKQSLSYVRESAHGDAPAKCVVFTSHSFVCREIIRQLRDEFGEDAIAGYQSKMSRHDVEDELDNFRTIDGCFALVCDRTGEEGRNLQFVDRIVHFDLPLAPNRIEQRIGRLDRIGRRIPINSTIFMGPECENSLFESWYKMLHTGFQVFDRSIASLQFFVEKELPNIILTLFRHGAPGVIATIPALQAGIAQEVQRLHEQDALDSVDAFEQNATSCFDSICRLEQEYAGMEDAMHDWAGGALNFARKSNHYPEGKTICYRPDFDRQGEYRTLVPLDYVKNHFAPHLRLTGAFNRTVALSIPNTPVFRIGEGFIDEMARYIHWDDRGQAFAFWRQEPAWNSAEGAEWVGFRFHYVVSTDLRAAKKLLTERGFPPNAIRAVARRADALFPPLVEVVYLDTDGVPLVDPELIELLQRPYASHRKGGSDYNLSNEYLEAIEEVVPSSLWESTCRTARLRSVEVALNRGAPPLRDRCEILAMQAQRALATRFAQIRIRATGIDKNSTAFLGVNDLDTERDLYTSMVHGIRDPELRLDSVGFIVVSGRPPQSGGTS